MLLSQIKIPSYFWKNEPNTYKLNTCTEYYEKNGRLDKKIIVDSEGVLQDGFIGYLVLLDHCVLETDVIVSDTRRPYKYVLVYGKFEKNGVVDCWRIHRQTRGINNLRVGRKAIVDTWHGLLKITVTEIRETSNLPIDLDKIRGVVRCLAE